jgi:uncharacterized protein
MARFPAEHFFEDSMLAMPLEQPTALEPALAPVSPVERIDAIDVLRGVALFGVLVINIVTVFRVSIFEQFLPSASTIPAPDRAVQTLLMLAFEMKALALFSFLFGAGLAIQFERLASNPRRTKLLARRLAVLLIIGLAHLFLIWNGDILTEYAVAGLVVLPFLWSPRWLLAASASLLLAVYLVMPLLPPVVPWPATSWIKGHIIEANQVYGRGGFIDILMFRIHEVPAIFPLHVWIFPRTVALFLFGMLAWRTGILRRPAVHRVLLSTVAIAGILVGGGLTVAADEPALLGLPSLGRAQFPLDRLAAAVLATGYGAAIISLVGSSGGKRMLAWAAPLGRMAFTNYLAQSLIFGWIFYGYGLGLFGRAGVTTALAIGICVYVAQVMISAQWLKYYRFGPVEWMWRSLMYGSLQPLRQHSAAWR